MAIEVINIRVYDHNGNIDASLSPAISLYDNIDTSLDFSGTMTWNSITKQYQFSPDIDISKTYTATIDFGVSALTRYMSFGVSYTGTIGGSLTSEQADQLASTVKKDSLIIDTDLGSVSIFV